MASHKVASLILARLIYVPLKFALSIVDLDRFDMRSIARLKFALLRSAPLKLATMQFAPMRSASLKLASLKLAATRLDPHRLVPMRLAACKFASLKFAAMRFALSNLAPARSNSLRSIPLIFCQLKSNLAVSPTSCTNFSMSALVNGWLMGSEGVCVSRLNVVSPSEILLIMIDAQAVYE